MKVLLTKDVYKLGRAGDIKRVADGYGRNYLIPQGLAILATAGAMKQAEKIRDAAATQRTQLNSEMSGVAEKLNGLIVAFPTKAGDQGKLYGSITPQMVAEAIQKKVGVEIDRHSIETQPIRSLGEHNVRVRLTVDLIPDVLVIVHREGETPARLAQQAEEARQAEAVETAEAPVATEEANEPPAA